MSDVSPESPSLDERASAATELHSSATTTLIFSFELNSEPSAVFSAERSFGDGDGRLWEEGGGLDEDELKRALRGEMLSLWGIGDSSSKAHSAQRYQCHHLSDGALECLFKDLFYIAKKGEQPLQWSPKSVVAVSIMGRRATHNTRTGLLSVTGEWRMPHPECGEDDVLRLTQAILLLRRAQTSKEKEYNFIHNILNNILSSISCLEPFSTRQPPSHKAIISHSQRVISTAHIKEDISIQTDYFQAIAWRLRRGYGRYFMPPRPEHDRDQSLWLRQNQFESFSGEGAISLNWACDGSDIKRDRSYHLNQYLKRRIILYWHCQIEEHEMNLLHMRALDLLSRRPMDTSKINDWREELNRLVYDMVDYSISVNIPVCSTRSDYQLVYQAIRSVFFIKDLRQDMETDIKMLYDVYETGLKEEDARQEEQYRREELDRDRARDERQRNREGKINNIVAITAPLVIISGAMGMNNISGDKFSAPANAITRSINNAFYFLNLPSVIIAAVFLCFCMWWWLKPESNDKA